MVSGSRTSTSDYGGWKKIMKKRPVPSLPRFHHTSKLKLITAGLILASVCLAGEPAIGRLPYGISGSEPKISESNDFSWSQVESKEELEFNYCFEDFECARLDVPLDWNATESGQKVSIALSRLPARVSVADPRYGGAILINPGGPGASGVNFLSEFAGSLRSIVDSPEDSESNDAKYYDLVAFDPRGIGYSKPIANCFPDAGSRDRWDIQSDQVLLKGSNDSFAEIWSRQYATSDGCSTVNEHGNNHNDLVQFINTAPVVTDMIEIIERLGQWREKAAKSWLQSPEGANSTNGKALGNEYHIDSVLHRTQWVQGQEKIQYWGFSYGTVIGATFAAMFPERIERFILDGVVDAEEFMKAGVSKSLVNTDEIWDRFFQYCFEAGPSRCKFHMGSSSPRRIRQRFDELLERVRNFPIAVPGSSSSGPEIVRYQDIIQRVFSALYKPIVEFPLLDKLLADLIVGNGSEFAAYKQVLSSVSCPSPSCEDAESHSAECDPFRPFNFDASRIIFCTDAGSIHDESPEAFKDTWDKLSEQSELFSDLWIVIRMACVGWKLRPSWRFGGLFTGNTSFPILWIGNSRDPVTPVSNARKMAQGFEGSEVLEIDTEGHCTFAGPSACAVKAINQYLQKGKLPATGTICQPDKIPFIEYEDEDRDTDQITFNYRGHDVHEL